MEYSTAESESGPQRMNFISKAVGIFTNPKTAFENIQQKSEIWFPIVLMLAITVISVLMTTDLQKQVQRDFINNSEIIPEDRKVDMLDNLDKQGAVNEKIVPALSGAVGIFLYYAVIAAAFLLFGNFIYGGDSTFKKMFSLAAWGSLIGVLESIIKIPLMLWKGTVKVFISPAVVMDVADSGTVFFKILDAFDIFAIWKIIVFSIGFSVFYKISREKSYTAVISLYVLYLIISIGLSQLFKGFIS
jgi:hypothetical protein